jgi:UDP-N-acetylglucosamine 2-epimerase (non-hydrolysing)
MVMTDQPRVTIVLGTRPEAIKLAPVIRAFQNASALRTRVVLTGQHREMVSQVMDLFQLSADRDLNLMAPRQTLTHVTCAALEGLREDFQAYPPQLVLVQGDTTTAFAAGLAAFYEQIPVGHVEAGLRTDNLLDPFPEEANRRLLSQIATLHFAPTQKAEANLRASGVVGEVSVTGNTVIDALLLMAETAPQISFDGLDWDNQRVILATVHRRENWGERLKDIASGMLQVLDRHPDTALLLPLHRNPTVREPLQALLVLRRTTERPEAVDAGTARLVGTQPGVILEEASRLLSDAAAYEAMSRAVNPFGDGKASQRILELSRAHLGV